MKKRICIVCAAIFLSMSASASTTYSFDISDVSWATITEGDTSNVTFWFEFVDGTDLNAVEHSDLLAFGVQTPNASGGARIFDLGSFNIANFFGMSGGVASLTVGGEVDGAIWTSNPVLPIGLQVGQGSSSSLHFDLGGEGFGYAFSSTVTHTYYSAVPIPAAGYLFFSALVGVAGLSRRSK
ncbi:MAG: hypothetical protein AB8G17_17025 [Gammaproteobacteria bacterium]